MSEERAALSIPFASPESAEEERDLLLLEQAPWRACGMLTRLQLARYLSLRIVAEAAGPVDCCGYGYRLAIPIRVYELRPPVDYRLLSTIGVVNRANPEQVYERESVTFNLTTRTTLRHPAVEVAAARWLTGPWTIGGASIPPPPLSVSGRELTSAVPVYGTVDLTLLVRRNTHYIVVGPMEYTFALDAATTRYVRLSGPVANYVPLRGGIWSEWAVGLPNGGRPVALEITAPPEWAEMGRFGTNCGYNNNSGDSGRIDGPEEEEPEAHGEDKYVRCDYCELECEDGDGEEGDG